MKKVKQYKGFIIALDQESRYQLFTKDEWSYGKGMRYAEHDTCTLDEAKEFIDCY
jgi:hypothetical protein